MSILTWIEEKKRLKLLNAPKHVSVSADSSKGLWTRCDKCGVILYIKHLKENQRVCFGCSYHLQMMSQERIENLLDKVPAKAFPSSLSSISTEREDFPTHHTPHTTRYTPQHTVSRSAALRAKAKRSTLLQSEGAKVGEGVKVDEGSYVRRRNDVMGTLRARRLRFTCAQSATVTVPEGDNEAQPEVYGDNDGKERVSKNQKLNFFDSPSPISKEQENVSRSLQAPFNTSKSKNVLTKGDKQKISFSSVPFRGKQMYTGVRETVISTWRPLDETVSPCDPLTFHDQKNYTDRLQDAQERTGLQDAIQTGTGLIDGIPVALAVMDFSFMGGSMGSVVGEKTTRLIEYATQEGVTLLIVSASGGARMQEGVFSLMQMAKISSALQIYQSCANLLYISILTSPTTGGVTASFAMLGDIIFAEPKALIAFAGRRVIEQTLCEDLPDDFQTSEYMLHHGLVDLIVPRRFLRQALSESIRLYQNAPFKKIGRIPFGVQNPISLLTEEKVRRQWGVLTKFSTLPSNSAEQYKSQNNERIDERNQSLGTKNSWWQSNFPPQAAEKSANQIHLKDAVSKNSGCYATPNFCLAKAKKQREKSDNSSLGCTRTHFQLRSAQKQSATPKLCASSQTHKSKVCQGVCKSVSAYGDGSIRPFALPLVHENIAPDTSEKMYREILTSFEMMLNLFASGNSTKEDWTVYNGGIAPRYEAQLDYSLRLENSDTTKDSFSNSYTALPLIAPKNRARDVWKETQTSFGNEDKKSESVNYTNRQLVEDSWVRQQIISRIKNFFFGKVTDLCSILPGNNLQLGVAFGNIRSTSTNILFCSPKRVCKKSKNATCQHTSLQKGQMIEKKEPPSLKVESENGSTPVNSFKKGLTKKESQSSHVPFFSKSTTNTKLRSVRDRSLYIVDATAHDRAYTDLRSVKMQLYPFLMRKGKKHSVTHVSTNLWREKQKGGALSFPVRFPVLIPGGESEAQLSVDLSFAVPNFSVRKVSEKKLDTKAKHNRHTFTSSRPHAFTPSHVREGVRRVACGKRPRRTKELWGSPAYKYGDCVHEKYKKGNRTATHLLFPHFYSQDLSEARKAKNISFLNQAIEVAATESVEWRAFYLHQQLSEREDFLKDFLQQDSDSKKLNGNMLFYKSICRFAEGF